MDKKQHIAGLLYGSSAFILWGTLPLYWRLVGAINAYQIFAHRVVWSLLFLFLTLLVKKELRLFWNIINKPLNWLKILGPAFFISANWLTYIWGVNNGFVIETSLGYYMNPLVLTLFGILFLKEHVNRLQKIGIALSAIGVTIRIASYGQVPWVALILAISFAIYGLLKKLSPLGSLKGLAFETLVVSIPAFFFLAAIESQGQGIIGNLPSYFWPLIAISGIATATPLLLFAESTSRLPLAVVGFLQYIAPTLTLLLGIFVFREDFSKIALLAFSFVWLGLLVFSYAQYQFLKKGNSLDTDLASS